MEYTMEMRAAMIINACQGTESINPMEIFRAVAREDFVRMHGPEHHILDGACILTAFKNAGGKINLEEALEKLMKEGLRMPGATCGLWGVCGSVTSIGAALAVIDGTGPLTTDDSWSSHMKYTSKALGALAEIGGPRCCKRDAYIAMTNAVEYINSHYPVHLECDEIHCDFSDLNQQCIHERCPYYQG